LRFHSRQISGGMEFLECRQYSKELSLQRETKAEAFWSKKSSKGKEEGHAQGTTELPLDQLERRD
jgi:hypothetical protein